MSEKTYFQRMLDKSLTSNQLKENIQAAKTGSESVDYWITQIIRECANDLDKRISAIEKQLTTKPKEA